jgi:hypothetical protein
MRTKVRVAVLRAVPIIAVVIGSGSGMVPAEAKSSPSFASVTAAASDQHDVAVSFTETGLSPAQVVTERLRGRAMDTYACYMLDGQRAGSSALIEHPASQEQFTAGAAGTIDSATIAISVVPLDVCPGGQISYLFKTVFGHLRLTDLSNHVAVDVRGSFTSCSPADCLPPDHL